MKLDTFMSRNPDVSNFFKRSLELRLIKDLSFTVGPIYLYFLPQYSLQKQFLLCLQVHKQRHALGHINVLNTSLDIELDALNLVIDVLELLNEEKLFLTQNLDP